MSEYLQIILLLAVVWELAYHWLFWSKLALREPKVYPETTQGVSVVIAARNEEKQLQKLITTLFEQDHPDFEVMVVNDRSDDNSQTLLEKLQAKYDRLKVHEVKELPQGWTGKKHAVFQGIHRSEKPLILLTDADFVETTGMEIIAGRDFSEQLQDSTNFLINEVAAGLMGFDDPIGKDLGFWGLEGKIVGVVKDFHMSDLYEPIAPLIITCYTQEMGTVALVRISGKPGAY